MRYLVLWAAILAAQPPLTPTPTKECVRAKHVVDEKCALTKTPVQTEGMRNLAQERRFWVKNLYLHLGFTINVPLPDVPDSEFTRRYQLSQALFYRPASAEVSYKQFMRAVGQANHWTVIDNPSLNLEPAKTGYWFWTEVQTDCPRRGQTWQQLSASLTLISLEEYVIVWYAHAVYTGKLLDLHSTSWSRTCYLRGALMVSSYDGEINAPTWHSQEVDTPVDYVGGRSVEAAPLVN